MKNESHTIFALAVGLASALGAPLMAGQELTVPASGAIRVKIHSFQYYPDPHGISYNSRGHLGEVTAFVLRIYAAEEMKFFIETVKSSEEIFGQGEIDKMVFIPDRTKYGTILVEEAKSLFGGDLRPQVENLFFKGGRLEIFVPGDKVPPFIDIPAPEGTYYIEYSLLFLDARNKMHTKVHPNYPHLSRDDSSILWGPPKVVVKAGMVANIDFRPTHNIGFYQYPDTKKGYFESSPGFWDWMKFLFWAGEISR